MTPARRVTSNRGQPRAGWQNVRLVLMIPVLTIPFLMIPTSRLYRSSHLRSFRRLGRSFRSSLVAVRRCWCEVTDALWTDVLWTDALWQIREGGGVSKGVSKGLARSSPVRHRIVVPGKRSTRQAKYSASAVPAATALRPLRTEVEVFIVQPAILYNRPL